ncbi:conserved hypothetical protein [Rhodopseudomonas palustris TIE-1]|uniref:hypothetical protein n=1 Tax=Rhodopseudomonas palustris TaxID=1076 RepID=UPI000164B40C|nr:hypothetical protein [Rhodopseudomonas palustris]ACF02488.1 conserved hypothetical protein [Rhodopseudomonas palustris TIE-1]
MAVPALNIPIRADVDKFQRDMNKAADVAGKATMAITSKVIAMNSTFLASQGAAGVATLALGRVLGVVGPLALAITAVKDTFDFLRYSVKLAGDRIEEFNGIAAKAASANVTTDFYQRIEKAAKGAGLSIDDSADALRRFNDATSTKLGGSDLDKRLKELSDAGNLSGNRGLAQLSIATGTEERIRTVVRLIDEAMQKGERLAAIDIAEKAFGSKVAANLKADAGYLDQLLTRADAISKAEIISEADVGRAIALKERMEEAHKILADKWKPIQNDIAELGINYRENTSAIVEKFAELVGLANQLYASLKTIPDIFAELGNSPIWSRLTELTGALGLNSDPAALGIETGIDVGRATANDKLRAALQNRARMMRDMQQASDVQTAVRGDTSRNPAPAKSGEANAFDTTAASIERHTARVQADTKAVGLGAAALDEMRARASLLTAAQQAGIEPTAAMTARIDKLAKAAGEAAEQLAKAKVNSEIDFGRKTAMLSGEDVAIAGQLRSIYGNDVPTALASSEAAALRLNEALRGLSGSIETSLTSGLADIATGAKSVSAGFADMGRVVIRALEEMIVKMLVVQPLMRALSGGVLGFADGGLVSAPSTMMIGDYAMPKFAGGGMISGPGTGRSDSIPALVSNGEFIVNADATARHLPILKAINENALPRFADGGLVGSGAAPMISPGAVVAPTVQVTVQGSPGMTATDHEEMGRRVGAAAMDQIRGMIAKEFRTQTRPGGALRR